MDLIPTGLWVSEEPLFGERKSTRVAEFYHPTLLHPSPSPAQISPLNCEKSCLWSSIFKPGKNVICHFCSGPTTPHKTYHYYNVLPHKTCWKSISSSKRVFLLSSHSLFPSAHEETTPSVGRDQILELRHQRNASESPPSIWCPRA